MKKHFFLTIIFINYILGFISAQEVKVSNAVNHYSINGTTINITQISKLIKKQITWIECVDYCRDLNEDGKNDWRMPSFEEAIFYRTNDAIKLPDNWGIWIWTTTPWDAKINSVAGPNNWIVFGESLGTWDNENHAKTQGCRCVR